jgi:hypothetical protein
MDAGAADDQDKDVSMGEQQVTIIVLTLYYNYTATIQ